MSFYCNVYRIFFVFSLYFGIWKKCCFGAQSLFVWHIPVLLHIACSTEVTEIEHSKIWTKKIPHIAPSRASYEFPDSKVHEAYMGFTWGRQDPGRSQVGPMNLVLKDMYFENCVENLQICNVITLYKASVIHWKWPHWKTRVAHYRPWVWTAIIVKKPLWIVLQISTSDNMMTLLHRNDLHIIGQYCSTLMFSLLLVWWSVERKVKLGVIWTMTSMWRYCDVYTLLFVVIPTQLSIFCDRIQHHELFYWRSSVGVVYPNSFAVQWHHWALRHLTSLGT